MSLNTTIFGQALAFLLFVLFCMKYVWPPLIQVLETRQKEIADSLHAAELGKSQLRLAQIEADKLIQKAKQDARAWMEQAELQRSEFLENARKEAQSLLQEQSACLTDQTIRFLHLLAEYRRLDSLPELASAFETWLDEQQGRVDVEVISAFPLSQQTLARLQAGLCNRLHQLKGSLRQQ